MLLRLFIYMISLIVISIGCDDPVTVPPNADRMNAGSSGGSAVLDPSLDSSLLEDQGVVPDLGPALDAAPSGDAMVELDQMVELDESPVIEPDLEVVPDLEPPRVVSRVEAQLDRSSSAAGEVVTLRCRALDGMGLEMGEVELTQELTPAEGWSAGAELGQYIGERAGLYQARCAAPELGLVSEQLDWNVTPSALSRVVASVADAQLEAGLEAQVSCAGFDAFDNAVELERPVISSSPSDGVMVTDGLFTATLAGEYEVTCAEEVSAGIEEIPVTLTVVPSDPAQLTIRLNSDRAFYRMGTRIRALADVVDRFGNELPSDDVVFTASPELIEVSPNRYELSAEGRFQVTGSLEVDSAGARLPSPLTDQLELTVDRGGPELSCDQPAYGASLIWSGDITLVGSASDTFGVAQVSVDGVAVQPDDQGRFTHEVTPRLGLNWNIITATDTFEQVSEELCVYFVAYDYLADGAPLESAIMLGFGASGIDDGEPALPIGSLADLLRIEVSSDEIISELNQAARAENPVIPNTCIQDSFAGCVLRVEGNLLNVEVLGSRPISLEASDSYGGSLGFNLRINRLRVNLRVQGRAEFGVSYNTTGHIEASFVSVGAHFTMGLLNDAIDVQVVPQSRSVSIGSISSDFGGALGAIINFTLPLFESALRDMIQSTLRDAVLDPLDEALSDALSEINVAELDFGLELDGVSGQAVDASINTALSEVSIDASGLKLGLSTSATYQAVLESDMPGAPILAEPLDDALENTRDLSMHVQLSLINQFLYTLWRAGFFVFDSEIGGASVGGAGAVSVQLNLLYPPVFQWTGEGSDLYLDFGPADVVLSNTDLFNEDLAIRLMTIMVTDLSLNEDGSLNFGVNGLSFEDIHIELLGFFITPESRATIQELLSALIMILMSEAVGEGLPSIPLPSLSVSSVGAELTLQDPNLSMSAQGITVEGDLGE